MKTPVIKLTTLVDYQLPERVELVVFDLDGTLVGQADGKPIASSIEFLRKIESAGIKTAIISNNLDSAFVKTTAAMLKIDMIYSPEHLGHIKPRTVMLNRLLKESGVSADKSVMIGDKYLTDVILAKRAGMHSVVWLKRTR
jgi:HAD superfamily phosphatase (TIGR01668 family)